MERRLAHLARAVGAGGLPSAPPQQDSAWFAEPAAGQRLLDEWGWARTRCDAAALEAALARLPPARRAPRVGIVGFILESNRFAPTVAAADFDRIDGPKILDRARGGGAPLEFTTGFVTCLDAALPCWEPVPLFLLNGDAAGPVDEAFCAEVIAEAVAAIEREQASGGDFDAVYCVMHGGMRAVETADSDGLFLQAVRQAVGPSCAVVSTLDLHANISEQMLTATDCLVALRTNPHVDSATRGESISLGLHAPSLFLTRIARVMFVQARRPRASCSRC